MYLTTKDAAELLGISPDTLRVQVRNGRIRAEHVGRMLVFAEAEVDRYARESRGRRGRASPHHAGTIAVMHRSELDATLKLSRDIEESRRAHAQVLASLPEGPSDADYLATASPDEVRRYRRSLIRTQVGDIQGFLGRMARARLRRGVVTWSQLDGEIGPPQELPVAADPNGTPSSG